METSIKHHFAGAFSAFISGAGVAASIFTPFRIDLPRGSDEDRLRSDLEMLGVDMRTAIMHEKALTNGTARLNSSLHNAMARMEY